MGIKLVQMLRIFLRSLNGIRTSPLGVTLAVLFSFSLGFSVQGDIKLIDVSTDIHDNHTGSVVASGQGSIAIGEMNSIIHNFTQLITNIRAIAVSIQEPNSNININDLAMQIEQYSVEALQLTNQLTVLKCAPLSEEPVSEIPSSIVYPKLNLLMIPSINRSDRASGTRSHHSRSGSSDNSNDRCDTDNRVPPNGSKYWICDPNGDNY